MIYKNYFIKFIYVVIFFMSNGCGIYSFSGASIHENAKTIKIDNILNIADLIQPTLSNNLTEALITKCQRETNLATTNEQEDIMFSGKITHYEILPISIQNNETAAQNRLTVNVNIDYYNRLDNSRNFKKTFTAYADFESDQNFSELED